MGEASTRSWNERASAAPPVETSSVRRTIADGFILNLPLARPGPCLRLYLHRAPAPLGHAHRRPVARAHPVETLDHQLSVVEPRPQLREARSSAHVLARLHRLVAETAPAEIREQPRGVATDLPHVRTVGEAWIGHVPDPVRALPLGAGKRGLLLRVELAGRDVVTLELDTTVPDPDGAVARGALGDVVHAHLALPHPLPGTILLLELVDLPDLLGL